MLILGVDPGSRVTACGLIDSKTKKSSWFIKKLSPKIEQADKIFSVFNFIDDLIKKHGPETVAIETPFYSTNIKSAMVLSEIKSAVIVASKLNSLSIFQYTPREVKQAICGYGAADKNQVKFVIEKTLNISLDKEILDVSDALAIALTHIYIHNL